MLYFTLFFEEVDSDKLDSGTTRWFNTQKRYKMKRFIVFCNPQPASSYHYVHKMKTTFIHFLEFLQMFFMQI